MRILVSNDDGIEARGIQALADAMKALGDVTIVAPDREQSGAGHSLTLHRPLRIHSRGEKRYAVDGTPTDCVTLAILEVMKKNKPDIVISGINGGPNLGEDITYSGTVAAALEGAIMGVPSIAMSLAAVNGESKNYKPAAYFAQRLVKKVYQEGLTEGVLLNVNVPNIEGDTIDDYEITRTGKRRYSGAIAEKLDPKGRKYYWIGGEDTGFDDSPGTDSNAVRLRKVSITPLRFDLTHDEYFPLLKGWQF